jgi:hypothetical protein
MLKKHLVKLGSLAFVLSALIISQPRTASAGLCCTVCGDIYDSCTANCAFTNPTCFQNCFHSEQACDRGCNPSC